MKYLINILKIFVMLVKRKAVTIKEDRYNTGNTITIKRVYERTNYSQKLCTDCKYWRIWESFGGCSKFVNSMSPFSDCLSPFSDCLCGTRLITYLLSKLYKIRIDLNTLNYAYRLY